MTTEIKTVMLAALVAVGACTSDGGGSADTDAGSSTGAADGSTGAMTMSTTSPGTTPGTTMTSSLDSSSGGADTGPDTGTSGGGGFVFDDAPPEDFVRVDRMGMPAVATAVITDKDDYNAASPADDAAGTFVEQIVGNLTGLHAALDDDLMAAGLTPCDIDTCVAQGAPLVVPDTLKLDLTADSGFPNGRLPGDPVVDLTLAVVLLDLGAHAVTTLADLPLNPPAGDEPLLAEFPYFPEPH